MLKQLLNQKKRAACGIGLTVCLFRSVRFARSAGPGNYHRNTRRVTQDLWQYRHLARTAFEMYWRHGFRTPW